MVTKANASHILVKTEQEAMAMKGFLMQGKQFEDLAKEYSTCPSAKKGGLLGWFGRGQMVKEFEQACFSARKGQIVGPIKTQFGFHVIRINDLN